MARPRKNEATETPWVVRDVPESTRKKVRVYAAENDMTMGQAVEALVDEGLQQRSYSNLPTEELIQQVLSQDAKQLLNIFRQISREINRRHRTSGPRRLTEGLGKKVPQEAEPVS